MAKKTRTASGLKVSPLVAKEEGHSATYGINANGEVIPSDNSLFGPNLDPNTNGALWVRGERG